MSTTGGVGKTASSVYDGMGSGGGGGNLVQEGERGVGRQGLHDGWEKGMEKVGIMTPQTCLTFRQLELPNPII